MGAKLVNACMIAGTCAVVIMGLFPMIARSAVNEAISATAEIEKTIDRLDVERAALPQMTAKEAEARCDVVVNVVRLDGTAADTCALGVK